MFYLVLGDGNFSFSLSLCKQLLLEQSVSGAATAGARSEDKVIATSFESLERVLQRPLAEEALRELSRRPGVRVLHSVDATRLEQCEEIMSLGLIFHVIIFNFPHTGGKGRIEQNRALLRDFFISVSKSSLLSNEGEIRLSLCRGQGGTLQDHPVRGHHNSWKLTEMAAEGGFVLCQIKPFIPSEYPDYTPTGYRGITDKGFSLEGALMHFLKYPDVAQRSLHPPTYEHDVSFWCLSETFKEDTFRSLVKRVCGDMVQEVQLIDEYRCEVDAPRVSYCYRLVYGSDWRAVARSGASKMQAVLRKSLVQEMGVELR